MCDVSGDGTRPRKKGERSRTGGDGRAEERKEGGEKEEVEVMKDEQEPQRDSTDQLTQ